MFSRKRVGVIELNGIVGRGIRPDLHVPLLERARKSRRIGALVLVVDSPGGAAAASEELYLAVAKVADVKPVVALVRERGASGAYYISCAAHKVVAVRNAVVGSIGVIFARPVAEQMFQKLGLSFSVQKAGANKDMFGPWRAPTPEETRKVQALTDEIYERFVEVVAERRKLDVARVKELATGELYTAQRAVTLGLIDELGDLERAVELAASMAKVKPRTVQLRPRRRFIRLFQAGIAREMTEAVMEEFELGLMGKLWM